MTTKIRFIRKPAVLAQFGFSKSTLANKINEGIFIPSILIGGRSVAWLEHELDALACAIAAGKGDDQLRSLVTKLLIQRQKAAA